MMKKAKDKHSRSNKDLHKSTSKNANPEGSKSGLAHDIKGKEKEDSKRRLLRIASRLFAEKGFSGVSTRDIVCEAGMNISLISYYFKGKEGLYRAVIEDFAHSVKEAVHAMHGDFFGQQENPSTEDNGVTSKHEMQGTIEQFQDQMRILISETVRLKLANPDIIIILQREMLEGLPNAKEIHETIFYNLAEKIIQIFQHAQARGFLRKDINPAVLFFSMLHAIDGYLIGIKLKSPLAKTCHQIPEELDAYIDDILKIFIKGVR